MKLIDIAPLIKSHERIRVYERDPMDENCVYHKKYSGRVWEIPYSLLITTVESIDTQPMESKETWIDIYVWWEM